MRILFLNYEYPPLGGGAGNATKYLLQEYSKHEDMNADLITSAVDGDFVETNIFDRITVFRLPIGKDGKNMQKQSQIDLLRYSFSAYRCIRKRILRGEKYDIIHAFFSVPCGVLALLLSMEFHIPFIVSLRGADVPGYAEKFRWIYKILTPLIRFVWKKSARVISNSEGLKQLALISKPDQEIGVIYNGVDTNFFLPDEGKRSSKHPTILCASRLTQRKGLQYAIEGFSRIADKYPHAKMIIAGGDGDAAKNLKQQVMTLNLKEKITFSGEYDHAKLLQLQQSSNIFLFPSLNEGMSNSMLEAMASGLPIIMTPTGGAQELIRNGENGFIVDFRSPESIAQKLDVLLSDTDLCIRMGRESRQRAEELNWSSVASEYRKIYKEIIHESN
ncbi:MAG: glycosyltransferase family 4 protein [Candidatus Moraniibacteriota bacterium]|nr:MAG: glycosyltransferase family 4 protein [Candidatus Moranbacteria bacterium]